jgi:hypothetical protein
MWIIAPQHVESGSAQFGLLSLLAVLIPLLIRGSWAYLGVDVNLEPNMSVCANTRTTSHRLLSASSTRAIWLSWDLANWGS